MKEQSREHLERSLEHVEGPYDYQALVEAYVLSCKEDFIHPDFADYYSSLVSALEQALGVRIARDCISHEKAAILMLFHCTVRSMLQVGTPWDGFLEAGLMHKRLEDAGTLGEQVYRASGMIGRSYRSSLAAHREMLYALFKIMFGEVAKVVTSEDLRRAGFDDTLQPNIHDDKYLDCW